MNITELIVVASILGTVTFLAAFIGAFLGSFMRDRKKLIVELIKGEEFGQVETLVTEVKSSVGMKKAVFLSEATEQDLQDMKRPIMSRFLNSFKIKK